MSKTTQIAIEGNIGCGKSALLRAFAHDTRVTVIEEPIHKWQNVQGINLLQLFYEDKTRWSYLFQSRVIQTRLENHIMAVVTKYKVMERSVFSGINCFVPMLYEDGYLNPVEMAVLSEWHDFALSTLKVSTDLLVYLRVDPEVALDRIRERGRHEELQIPLSYLTRLHEKYENWLIGKSQMESVGEVKIINGNASQLQVIREFEEILRDHNSQNNNGLKLGSEENGEVIEKSFS